MAGRVLAISLPFLLVAASLLVLPVQTDVFTPEQEARVVSFMENLLRCRGVVGATVAVVSNGSTWTRGFGLADMEAGVPVNSSTLFNIGSITKLFSSALLSLYVDEKGPITWQTLIYDILGKDFKLADDYVTHHVTIKDVLLHRSGVMFTNLPLFAGWPDKLSTKEFVRRLRYVPMRRPFRDRWEYNNLVYSLAGRLTEVLAGGGTSWEDLLQTRLLGPAGMTATRVVGKTAWPGQGGMAKAYVQLDNEVVESDSAIYSITPLDSAGAIVSTADDMARWMQVLLNKGQTPEGTQVLNSTRLEEMTSSYVSTYPMFQGSFLQYPVHPVTYYNDGYGYAWMTGSYRGYPVKMHSGGLYGFVSWQALIPDFNLGVFISTNGPGNSNASLFYRLAFYYIVDTLILAQTGSSEESWLNETTSCQFPAPWTPPKAPSNDSAQPTVNEALQFQNAQRYAGSYGSYAFGDMLITLNGTGNLSATYNRLHGRLYRPRNTSSEDPVGLLEISGPMAFLSRPQGGARVYVTFTFDKADPNAEGQFREVRLHSDALGEAVPIVFTRGARFDSPPADENVTSSGGSAPTQPGLPVYFVHVFTLCLLFLSREQW